MCTPITGVSHSSASMGKFTPECWKGTFPAVDESWIQEEQWGFHPGHGTIDQPFTLEVLLICLLDFAKPIYMCFVDLQKPYETLGSVVGGTGPFAMA